MGISKTSKFGTFWNPKLNRKKDRPDFNDPKVVYDAIKELTQKSFGLNFTDGLFEIIDFYAPEDVGWVTDIPTTAQGIKDFLNLDGEEIKEIFEK